MTGSGDHTSREVEGRRRRFDVTSVGEALLRLSVGKGRRLADVQTLEVAVAGSESNVCAALAALGRRTAWASRLPDDPLGDLVLRRARQWGIGLEAVRTAPGRLGTYYIEFGARPVPTRVTYDRAGSAFSKMAPDEVDWQVLLDGRIVHLTGITAALGAGPRAIVEQAVRRARERDVLVSFDVNYRSLLWSPDEAAGVLRPLLAEADIVLCGLEDAVRVFGLPADGEAALEGLCALTAAEHVVVTLGSDGAIARSGGSTLRRAAVPVAIVDPIGAGDAFAAGVLDGLLDGSMERGLEMGVALAALALAQHGDVVTATRRECEDVLRSDRDVIR